MSWVEMDSPEEREAIARMAQEMADTIERLYWVSVMGETLGSANVLKGGMSSYRNPV